MRYRENSRCIPALSANLQLRERPGASSRSSHGQAAVEVLIYMGFFMMIFVSFTVILLVQVNQDVARRQQQVSQSVADQVGQDVDLAILAGPGFNATFPIPDHIAGQPYELYFNDAGYMYLNLTNSNPAAYPVMFYYPLSTRRIELACDGATNPQTCPNNAKIPYIDFDGKSRTEWKVDTSDGTLHLEHAVDANGFTVLRVS